MQATLVEPKNQTPFATVLPIPAKCDRCLDTGIWLTPKGLVETCPAIQLAADPHDEPNKASSILANEAMRMTGYGLISLKDPMEFELAQILTHFTCDEPCIRWRLDEHFYPDSDNDKWVERRLKKLIENLRDEWLLPIGSHRTKPFGYWMITSLEEYEIWFKHGLSASITQFSKFHKNAKHNYPVFAEQQQLGFWKDRGNEND